MTGALQPFPAALTDAQQQYVGLLADTSPQSIVRWRLDLGNAGLLSRSLPILASKGGGVVQIEIPAVDRSEMCTQVADEAAVVGLLRHLQLRAAPNVELRFSLSVGRAYVMPPPALDLSTTTRCSLACAMCGSRFAQPSPDQLCPDEIHALIDQAASWGVRRVALTGAGEPFGDPNMLGYIERSQLRGLRPTVTTNGTPVSETLANALAPKAMSVSVSIHGATNHAHDAIVGVPGSWARAWTAVRRLIAARQQAGSDGRFTVSVSSVIQRDNLDEIPQLLLQSLQEGCDGHNLQPVNVQAGDLQDGRILRCDDAQRKKLLWPGAAERGRVDALFDALEVFSAAHPGHLRGSRERISALRSHFHDSHRAGSSEPCRVGYMFLGVDHRGQLRPCYRVPWRLGSVRTTSPQVVWNSQAYDRVRKLMTSCPLTCMNNCFFRAQQGRPTT